MKILILSFFVIYSLVSIGQTTFQGILNPGGADDNEGWEISRCEDGSYILAGIDRTATTEMDASLTKVSANGNVIWSKAFAGGWDLDDEASTAVMETYDGGFLMAARAITILGDDIAYVVRTDENGDTLWCKEYAPTGATDSKIWDIGQTSDGNYLLSGYSLLYGAGSEDMWCLKIDDNGDTLWTKTYGTSNDELGYDLFVLPDDGFLLAGTADLDVGHVSGSLVRADANGDTIWVRHFPGASWEVQFVQVTQTLDGGFIAAMQSEDFNLEIIKVDANGNLLVNKTFDHESNQYLGGITTLENGDVLVVGRINGVFGGGSYGYAVCLDENADHKWARAYDYDGSRFNAVVPNTDVGFTALGDAGGGYFLLRADSLGQTTCVDSLLIPSEWSEPMIPEYGCIIGAGAFPWYSPVDTINPLSSESFNCWDCDSITAAYDFTSTGMSFDFSNLSEPFLTSWMWDFGDGTTSTEFNPSKTYIVPGEYTVCLTVTNECSADTICIPITASDIGISQSEKKVFYAYPNPTDGALLLNPPVNSFEIVSLDGKTCLVGGPSTKIDVSELKNGIYFLRTEFGMQRIIKK